MTETADIVEADPAAAEEAAMFAISWRISGSIVGLPPEIVLVASIVFALSKSMIDSTGTYKSINSNQEVRCWPTQKNKNEGSPL